MNDDELKALTDSIKTAVMTEVHNANSGLASNLNKQIKELKELKDVKEPANESKTDSIETKELRTQLNDLTERLNKADLREKQLTRDKALSVSIDGVKGVNSKQLLGKVLSYELADKITFSEGKAYVEIGDKVETLDAYVNNYVQAEDAFKPKKNSNIPLVKESELSKGDRPSQDDLLTQLIQKN